MMNAREKWSAEDSALDREFAEIIEFVRQETDSHPAPAHLNRKIATYAKAQGTSKLEKNWLLGQGTWVILVTCISTAILSLVILYLVN